MECQALAMTDHNLHEVEREGAILNFLAPILPKRAVQIFTSYMSFLFTYMHSAASSRCNQSQDRQGLQTLCQVGRECSCDSTSV
eukprot:2042263-Amphidinium_carterae.2